MDASLFPNDGSFIERFKQLQEQALDSSSPPVSVSHKPSSTLPAKKPPSALSAAPKNAALKPASAPNGKLAFSFKQKSKLPANPLKLGDEDEEEEDAAQPVSDPRSRNKKLVGSPEPKDTIPPPPNDPEVKKVADKLASFVAKHGKQFEDVTRQKNPGDTLFRFLFDIHCQDYKYYKYRVSVEEKALAESDANDSLPAARGSSGVVSRSSSSQQKSGFHQHTNYQTPASALYAGSEDQLWSQQSAACREAAQESSLNADSLAMMEFYMKKAAAEDLRKPAKRSRDEMPPPASLQAPSAKKGHHMGDYIPPEELEKFLAKCNDAVAQKVSKEVAERAKIQSDNVGHKLLSKMGWKEGEGLGSGKSGRADPVQAGAVKLNNLGVGAEQPGEVSAEDDIYEQYKKRMMLGYRFRPNPLNNPRKAYY